MPSTTRLNNTPKPVSGESAGLFGFRNRIKSQQLDKTSPPDKLACRHSVLSSVSGKDVVPKLGPLLLGGVATPC
jgi:hypothetical protein